MNIAEDLASWVKLNGGSYNINPTKRCVEISHNVYEEEVMTSSIPIAYLNTWGTEELVRFKDTYIKDRDMFIAHCDKQQCVAQAGNWIYK